MTPSTALAAFALILARPAGALECSPAEVRVVQAACSEPLSPPGGAPASHPCASGLARAEAACRASAADNWDKGMRAEEPSEITPLLEAYARDLTGYQRLRDIYDALARRNWTDRPPARNFHPEATKLFVMKAASTPGVDALSIGNYAALLGPAENAVEFQRPRDEELARLMRTWFGGPQPKKSGAPADQRPGAPASERKAPADAKRPAKDLQAAPPGRPAAAGQDDAVSAVPPGAPGAQSRTPPQGADAPSGEKAFWWLLGLAAALLLGRAFRRTRQEAPVARVQAAGEASGPADEAPGSSLTGLYRIERELGRGGMGVVYEALDLRLHRPVALKRLRREAYDSPDLRERFMKEARLAARLKHPNLAEVFTVVGEEDLYIVFELVQGETLAATLSTRGPLALDEAKRVVADVCAALRYAHAERVIHRDLKPANIMIGPDGSAKVMDFGIAHEARAAGTLTQTTPWGTPAYMAPEQEMGGVRAESDLYALGVATYEMLTGKRPFAGPYSLDQKLRKEFHAATSERPGLPASVDAFFSRALEPDLEKRFRSAEEYAEAFGALA